MNNQPPSQGTPLARVKSATVYPPGGQAIVFAPASVHTVAIQGNTSVLITLTADGGQQMWVNVPMMIEHEKPSGLVAPTRGI